MLSKPRLIDFLNISLVASVLPLIKYSLTSILQLSKEEGPAPVPTPAKVSSTPALNYITLGSFSWDQDNEKVKVRL